MLHILKHLVKYEFQINIYSTKKSFLFFISIAFGKISFQITINLFT